MTIPLSKKAEKVYAITYDKNYERSGEPAEIVGFKKVSHIPKVPQMKNYIFSDLYFVIKFEDGVSDMIPKDELLDKDKWHIATLQEILKVGMP
jgi:hypothetical protein